MTATDLELLQKYSREGCEVAFAEVVGRYVDLVYSVALRSIRAPHLAEEVCQLVFLDLARSHHRLKPDTILAAWLHQVTRRVAADLIRGETRRQAREQIAHDMNIMQSSSAADDWERIQPWLDDGMAELAADDRAALLLRFFQGKSFKEIGATIGISDDTAQKRVSRAVDRLRNILQQRGVTVGVGSLTVILSSQAVQAAPAGLASAIAGTAAAKMFAGGALTATTTQTIAMTTIQKTLIALTIAGAIGVALQQTYRNRSLHEQLAALQQQTRTIATNAAGDALAITTLTNADALAYSLAQAQAEKQKLTLERDAAERLAQVYKELAQSRENSGLTNKYPTERHLTAALGRMVRGQFLSSLALGDKKPEDLTPEEKSLLVSSSAQMLSDYAELTQAAVKLQHQKQSGAQAESAARDPVDDMTVFAYGMLDLNEQQFQQGYSLFQRYYDEAARDRLLGGELSASSQEALQALNERAQAELRQVLTPEQRKTWDSLGPNTQLFGPSGLFNSFSAGSPWDKLIGL